MNIKKGDFVRYTKKRFDESSEYISILVLAMGNQDEDRFLGKLISCSKPNRYTESETDWSICKETLISWDIEILK